MIYTRVNDRVFFLLPCAAVGTDNGRYFFEVAWFQFAIGFGSLDDDNI